MALGRVARVQRHPHQTRDGGTALGYEFVQTLKSIRFLMLLRVVGGALYLTGFLLMIYTLTKTIRSGRSTPTANRSSCSKPA